MEKPYDMKDWMIPVITPELQAIFHDAPCGDSIHHDDFLHMGCRATKTLILREDGYFALVHSSLVIRPGYFLRRPDKAASEILLRMRTHGDPCVPSHLPESARSCERLKMARLDKCRTHWKDGKEVDPPARGQWDNEEDEYIIVPQADGLGESEEDFAPLPEPPANTKTPQRLTTVSPPWSSKGEVSVSIHRDRYMVEAEDTEEDWEVLDGDQVFEDYWCDFDFHYAVMRARLNAQI